jgi:hypothetical protein
MSFLADHEKAALEAEHHEALAKDRNQYDRLLMDAQTVYRAFEGWQTLNGREDWLKRVEESRTEYDSGHFLIDRLGATKFLDPTLMATLLRLREGLLAELAPASTADHMLADGAVLAYYLMIRQVNWIGSLALHLEHESFGQPSPAVKLSRQYGHGQIEALAVEDRLKRLGEDLLPLLDRCNKMYIRNLKTMRELRRGGSPAVAINRVDQVNVGQNQANAVYEQHPAEENRALNLNDEG